jgi:hypothetical protein
MGKLDHLRLHAKTLGQSWVRGLRQSERLFTAALGHRVHDFL